MSITNETAVRGDCSSHSRLFQTILSDNKYSTGNSSSVNTCSKCVGRERAERGEWASELSRDFLKKAGIEILQQIDWLGWFTKDKLISFEIKGKELFEPGPNFPDFREAGIGLAYRQVYLRSKLLEYFGIPTYVMNFVPGTTDVYGAWLSELEKKGGYIQTPPPNSIRIYPLSSYNKGYEAIERDITRLPEASLRMVEYGR